MPSFAKTVLTVAAWFVIVAPPGPGPLAATTDPVPAPATRPRRVPLSLTPPAPRVKDPRFDGLLGELLLATREPTLGAALSGGGTLPATLLPGPIRAALDAGLLRVDEGGAAQVYLHIVAPADRASRLVEPDGLTASLTRLGAWVERADTDRGILQTRVPLESLDSVAALPGVRYVSSPRYAVADAGWTMTEGDAILGADRVRDRYGVDGRGIRVGVISDGIYGIATAVQQGELPQATFVRTGAKLTRSSGGLTAVSFRSDQDLEAGLGSGRGSEGVAMLEIIHDLAPAAELWFANFSTDLEFNAAVDFMAANVDILVDDISFFGGPYDGTSGVSAHAASALQAPGRPLRAFRRPSTVSPPPGRRAGSTRFAGPRGRRTACVSRPASPTWSSCSTTRASPSCSPGTIPPAPPPTTTTCTW